MNTGRPSIQRWLGAWLAALSLVAPAASASASAPEPWTPPGATVFAPEGRWEVEGAVVRVVGFVSDWPVARVLDAARRAWPQPIAQGRIGVAEVLGRRFGESWVTLRVEPTEDGGSRGWWSASPLRDRLIASQAHGETESVVARWFAPGFPSPRLMRSVQGGTEVLVATSSHSIDPEVQVAHLRQTLHGQGLRSKSVRARVASDPTAGWIVVFDGDHERVTAAIQRGDAGLTRVTVVRERRLRSSTGDKP